MLNWSLMKPYLTQQVAAAGDANGDGNRDASEDEFIEFVNNSNTALDISGYKVYDATNFALLPAVDMPNHLVPAATTIPANGIYVLFGGGTPTGIPGDVVQTSTSGNLSLNNSDDVITITDAAGTVIATFDSAAEGVNMGSDQSAMRNPNITGAFVLHITVNGDSFSPGVLAVDTTPTTNLVINEALFDPAGGAAGDANGDGNRDSSEDEFIEFVNNSSTALDISGYKIYDEDNFALLPAVDTPNHLVPANSSIPANGVYVLFGGGTPTGIPGDLVQTSSSGDLNLTNSDDIIIVTDAAGNVLLTFNSAAEGVNMNSNQSAMRDPNINGPFALHTSVNGDNFSPGVLAVNTTPSTNLVINEVLYDPSGTLVTDLDGDANGDGARDTFDDEFIEFVNNATTSLDISGYEIFDATALGNDDPRHVVPAGTVLPAGGVYVVFGGGSPAAGGFGNAMVDTASSSSLNLTNGGEVITIKDAQDNVIIVLDTATFNVNFADNQSVTRSPEITGDFVLHTTAAANALFSPGTAADGSSLSTDKVVNFEFKMYPNPVSNGMLNISTMDQNDLTITIFDLAGTPVLNRSLTSNRVNISKLSSGFYIVKVSNNSLSSVKKLIVQ